MIIPGDLRNFPSTFEIKIAGILCETFWSNTVFVDVGPLCTPDVLIEKRNQLWEVKALDGNSPNTVHHALGRARKQSTNVVLAVRKTRLRTQQIIGKIKGDLKDRRDIKRLILVTKEGKVIVIKGKV